MDVTATNRSKTPNIDKLAKDGVRFEHTYSTIPVTLPAHSSMLTGQIPPVHGVRDNGGDQLSESAETIAEVLKSAGYRTGAFIGAEPLKHDRGLNQGFEVYDDRLSRSFGTGRFAQRPDRPAEVVAANFVAWAHTCPKEQPMFAFVHFFDPHWPYEKNMPGEKEPSYLGEIAHVDRVIGKLFSDLNRERSSTNRIVVVTADHGEGLGEHNEKNHCIFVYDSTLRVPMIVSAPNLTSKVIPQPVGIIDIAPTILELAGLEELEKADGISLVDAIESGEAEIRDLYFESRYAEFRFGWAPLKGIRRNNMKYIDAPRPEVYDLGNDPGELNNLYDENKNLASQLDGVLTTIGDGLRTQSELSDEAIRKLANLGYVAAKVNENQTGPRPDPKDRIKIYDQFQSAYQEFLSGDKERALEIMIDLESALSGSPQYYFELAFFQTELKKWAEAEASYRQNLELESDYPKSRQNLAAVLIQLKKFKEARSELDDRSCEGTPTMDLGICMLDFVQKNLEITSKAVEHWRKVCHPGPKSSRRKKDQSRNRPEVAVLPQLRSGPRTRCRSLRLTATVHFEFLPKRGRRARASQVDRHLWCSSPTNQLGWLQRVFYNRSSDAPQ